MIVTTIVPPVPLFQNEPFWSGGRKKRVREMGKCQGGPVSQTYHPGRPQALSGTEEPPPGRKGPKLSLDLLI